MTSTILLSNFFLKMYVVLFSDDASQPQVLIAVQSGPKNKDLRSEVRRTWGHACRTLHSSWCTVIFVLGQFDPSFDPSLQTDLENEAQEHRDILQESFQDSYNNLTLKTIFILKYYAQNSDTLGNKFLLKTDDDSFVQLEALWDLAKSRIEKKSNNLIGKTTCFKKWSVSVHS